MFTGNQDTDLTILLSFTLMDIQSVCSSSRYINELCNNSIIKKKINDAKRRAERAVQYLNINNILELQYNNFIIDSHLKILNDLNFHMNNEDDVEHNSLLRYASIVKDTKDYFIESDSRQGFIVYTGTSEQIRQYLMHVIYDNALFII